MTTRMSDVAIAKEKLVAARTTFEIEEAGFDHHFDVDAFLGEPQLGHARGEERMADAGENDRIAFLTNAFGDLARAENEEDLVRPCRRVGAVRFLRRARSERRR